MTQLRNRQTKSDTTSQNNKQTQQVVENKHPYEFGGPIGAFGIILSLPLVVLFLYYGVQQDFLFKLYPLNLNGLLDSLPQDIGLLFNIKAFAGIVGWFLFQVLLERILPGEHVNGVVLRDGTQLQYKLNGHLAFWVTLLVMGCCFPYFNYNGQLQFTKFPMATLYDNYLELAVASMVFSILLSIYLYVSSFKKGKMLALGGNSGNAIYDFYMGRELNPRIGGFDLKQFCEQKPGLIGWLMLDIGCAAKQYELYGSISYTMMLVVLFQGFYVWDSLYYERSILTTMDITTDGFGFMLAFGDLSWVPFTYSLQARYLATVDPMLNENYAILAAIIALKIIGYAVFRGANSTKDAFRKDPNDAAVKHIKFIETKSGRKLMTSGWWGMARKINYTGDWLMAVSWCLCTEFECILTWFYAIYFLILLVHRAYRDEQQCSAKYGSDWKKYKQAVPSIFIPGII